jgi:F0F1-type ATP synthase membrane subunit b/b'
MKGFLAAVAGAAASVLALAQGIVAETSFDNTISTGAVLITAVLGIGTVVGVIYGARYKVGYEAASAAARELRSALEDAARREDELKEALAESQATCATLRAEVTKLEALPNLALIIDKMAETAERQDAAARDRLSGALVRVEQSFQAAMEMHEENAERRHRDLLQHLSRSDA